MAHSAKAINVCVVWIFFTMLQTSVWFTLCVSVSPCLSLALSCLISKAVCYLNNHGEDYKGGILQFQDGDPSSIVPVAGVSKSTFTLIPVQNTFLMKDTYLFTGKLSLGSL
jgi:hypothetical protein